MKVNYVKQFFEWLNNASLDKKLSKHIPFYLFESKYPKRKNFHKGFTKLLKELKIKTDERTVATRNTYDDSDYTIWCLLFGESEEDKERLSKAKEQLLAIEFENQKIFSVSGNGWGNGWGNGLSIGLNYNKFYK